jgi:hypothetical protein
MECIWVDDFFVLQIININLKDGRKVGAYQTFIEVFRELNPL